MKKFILVILLCFFSIVEPTANAMAGTVELVGIEDEGHDHTGFYSDINQYLKDMGYSDNQIIQGTNITPAQFLDAIIQREIIVTRSHGGKFEDKNGNPIGNFICLSGGNVYNSDIEDLASNSLSNASLVVYVGCYTAIGGVGSSNIRNLVVATTERGAATAVGFTKIIYCDEANTWVKYCFYYLSKGDNVDRAVNKAVTATKKHHYLLNEMGQLGIDSMLYRGAWDTTFK